MLRKTEAIIYQTRPLYMRIETFRTDVLPTLSNFGKSLRSIICCLTNILSNLLVFFHLLFFIPILIAVVFNLNGQTTKGFLPKALSLYEGAFGALMVTSAILISLLFFFNLKWRKGLMFFLYAGLLFVLRSFVTLLCCLGS